MYASEQICSGGTYPLAGLFPWNIFAAEEIRYDTGATCRLHKLLFDSYSHLLLAGCEQ